MSTSNSESGFGLEEVSQEEQGIKENAELLSQSPEMESLTSADEKLKDIYETATEALSPSELAERYPELANLDREGVQKAGLELNELVDPNGRSVEMLGAELEIISDVLRELNPSLFDSLASQIKDRDGIDELPSLNRMIRDQLGYAKKGWAKDKNGGSLPKFDVTDAITNMPGEQALKLVDRLSNQLDVFLSEKKRGEELVQKFQVLDGQVSYREKPDILKNEGVDGLAARAVSQGEQGNRLISEMLIPLQEKLKNYKEVVTAKEEAQTSAAQNEAAA
ncbi:hypothetical protein COV06_01410 [Candidatus Uhrbacteria bacterium CG10_big_fil_rev_8_21_14_0_10_50_16]|uniref:Uncharacterized protein n=1 Tax=Candidatus Uhrbacteria bacterium CG10_big_fil_rev_8_21_14_0_10_50_16 TaxID=1975039 RepID=A0A2H0RNE8_9BACT|nr:MAG: hypothetical protein COV06_01410 [Candidatus Uhrbacteria bacterium CG10_big_fil_rev_8_21_14_0_10_50_16]